MDLAKIQKLLKIVSESGVAEVEVEEDDFKLTIRQNAPTVMMQPAMPSYSVPYPAQGMPPQAAGGYPMQNASQQPPPAPQQNASQSTPSAPVHNNNNTGSAAAADTDGSASEEGDVSVSADEHVITAELVGTFYRAPSPDADPFVEVGDRIEEGDVLCIIEAMKIMNEIECETPGVIKKVLVENAEPVEFDQPLFVIEPA